MKTPPVLKPVEQVLAELAEKHPELLPHVEQDRDWLWLAVDLRGEENKAVRESIGRRGLGFIYAADGHALPSGRNGTWAHHAMAPRRFHRKGKSKNNQPSTPQFTDADLLAALE